jgi:hypothetical protein
MRNTARIGRRLAHFSLTMRSRAWGAAEFVTLALSLFICWRVPLALAADDESTAPKFHLFVPTTKANPEKGRADSLRVQFVDVELSQMGDILTGMKAVLPEFKGGRVPTIPFYISRERSPEEQALMVAEARDQFRKAYPGVEPRIQVRYLEEEKVDVEALSKRLDERIDEMAKSLPEDPETRRQIEILHEANLKARLATLEAAKTREGFFQRPARMRRVVQAIASTKAVLNFTGRVGQAWSAGDQGAVPVLSGIGLIGAAPALEYFGSRFETEMAEAFSKHSLPAWSESELYKKANDFYTHNPGSQFVKGATLNALLWGVADPALMQLMGHINNPGKIPMVSGENLGVMAAAAFPSAFLYMGGYLGMENLRQKGWMQQPALDLALRSTGVVWQAAEFVLSTGNPHLQKMLLPLLLGPLWTGLAGATLMAGVLPARNDRFVLVDGALGNHEDIHALEALESTRNVERSISAIEAAVREIETLKPLERHGFLVKVAVESCRYFFGGLKGRKPPD